MLSRFTETATGQCSSNATIAATKTFTAPLDLNIKQLTKGTVSGILLLCK